MADSTDSSSSVTRIQFKDVPNLAEKLLDDTSIVGNWEQLCICLGIPYHEQLGWKHQLAMGILAFPGLLRNILNHWAATDEEGTLVKLCKLLSDGKFSKSAESLRKITKKAAS